MFAAAATTTTTCDNVVVDDDDVLCDYWMGDDICIRFSLANSYCCCFLPWGTKIHSNCVCMSALFDGFAVACYDRNTTAKVLDVARNKCLMRFFFVHSPLGGSPSYHSYNSVVTVALGLHKFNCHMSNGTATTATMTKLTKTTDDGRRRWWWFVSCVLRFACAAHANWNWSKYNWCN